MKSKTKIIIGVIFIILIGLFGVVLWSLTSGQKVAWITETGEERSINIPKIPGMELVSEEKNECSYQADYVYGWYKNEDVSDYIKNLVKDSFLKKDWILKDERTENGYQVLDFYTEKVDELETMTIKIGFEQGEGTFGSLTYRWPPCSEEEFSGV